MNEKPIVIIDYDMGNLQSLVNALHELGENAEIIQDPEKLRDSKAIILPGVGDFGDGMNNLREKGFLPILNDEIINKKKPYFGICLGMQFLAEKSFEYGEHDGFGWLKGNVERIKPNESQFKIPHIGWNNIDIHKETFLFENVESPIFYFVHSFFLNVDEEDKDSIVSTVWHGQELTASVQKDNIVGTQFHPEKSQASGLILLKNFIDYVNEERN